MPDATPFLGPPLTADYRPAVLGYGMIQSLYTGQLPLFMLGEVEAMRADPQVQLAVAILRAPLHQLKWTVEARDGRVAEYVDSTLRRVWDRALRKIVHYVEYGNAAGEPLWAIEGGLVRFQQLRDVYPRDAVPLVKDGMLCGVQVKGAAGGTGEVRLYPPRAFWVAHRPRHGSYYGYSRYNGAWWPWLEKRGRHGATDVRRLWYIKNAYTGGVLYHPPGMTERPDGSLQSNQDYAREIVEKAETGGVLALPNATDPNTGKRLWEYLPPTINGDLSGVRDYARNLDEEILQGFEIPPEVARAAETGSGWSGRSVPFLVFLTGEDELAREIIESVDRWIIRPGVWVNFGPGQVYEIKPRSLVELLGQQQGEDETPGQPQYPGPSPPPLDRPVTAQRRVAMSLADATDRGRENVSTVLDEIIEHGAAAGVAVGDEVRRRIRALVKKNSLPTN